jgi:uncharacterized NAD(P)/FAD-binding protein YdhS
MKHPTGIPPAAELAPTTGKRVAVIGAGFTGSLLAVHLLTELPRRWSILLFDGAGRFGRGLAYSTANAEHLLNVRVANMSAFPDDPGNFTRWLARKAGGVTPGGADDLRQRFVSRQLYGDYVAELLATGRATAQEVGLATEATDVTRLRETPGGIEIATADGRKFIVDIAILCVGNFPPALPDLAWAGVEQSARCIGNPWDLDRLRRIGEQDPVLILGTGLTMVDLVLSLEQQGHRGPITAISRRGLLPQEHAATSPYHDYLGDGPLPSTTLAALVRIRREVRHAASAGFDWRSVFDALRPHSQRLWRNLSEAEKRRFLRHARPYWDVHRHRMAPAVAARIRGLIEEGRLQIRAGRLRGLVSEEARIVATVAFKGEAKRRSVAAAWLVNCSGPETNFSAIRSLLVRQLLADGLVRPDTLRLGLDVGDNLALVGADGRPSRRLFALGPPTRGALWEITAVPDIRSQCRSFANYLVGLRDRDAR